jgi:2'-5' RNA ligase
VKRGARAGSLPDLPPPPAPMRATELTLYRSTLRPQGALYEPLAQHRLR